MIVWVSSFPRSGNTFLRIALTRMYGVRTSVVYDFDGVAQRLGPDLIGFEERPASIATLRESDELHFVKTHRQRDSIIEESDSAICLVRDGRDSLVSWARLNSEQHGREYRTELRSLIGRQETTGTGSWGCNVLSWLRPPAPHRVLLHYSQLVRAPRIEVERVMAALVPEMRPLANAEIPSFSELQQVDSGFFRKGVTGSHRTELPDDIHQLFWSRPDNIEAMEMLGYGPPS